MRTEPAQAHIKNRVTGEPIYYKQILKLHYSDGTETFGCIHCDYTSTNLNSIRPHLNKHNRVRKPKPPRKQQPSPVVDDGVFDEVALEDIVAAIEYAQEARERESKLIARIEAMSERNAELRNECGAHKRRATNAVKKQRELEAEVASLRAQLVEYRNLAGALQRLKVTAERIS